MVTTREGRQWSEPYNYPRLLLRGSFSCSTGQETQMELVVCWLEETQMVVWRGWSSHTVGRASEAGCCTGALEIGRGLPLSLWLKTDLHKQEMNFHKSRKEPPERSGPNNSQSAHRIGESLYSPTSEEIWNNMSTGQNSQRGHPVISRAKLTPEQSALGSSYS